MTFQNRVKERYPFLILIAVSFLFSLIAVGDASSQPIHLNEVMASNSSIIADEDGNYGDWIEVYNSGDNPISLEGYGLSDDYDRPFRWAFPDTTLDAGAFMLIWATNKDRATPGNELHTNYAISAAGEEVILTHPDGTRIDELEPTEIPTDFSIGRYPDGTGEWVFFDEPTPGQSNSSEPIFGLLEEPLFSHEPGFYTDEFELSISHPQERVTIYYTLDGSEPTTSSSVYSSPILITNRSNEPNRLSTIPTNYLPSSDWKRFSEPRVTIMKSSMVRTLAVKDHYIPSSISATYFVNPSGNEIHQLPVISIMTNEENFFDHNLGIYVPGRNYRQNQHDTGNYFERGANWEREAVFEFYDKNGERQISQNVGVRIHGGWNRRLPQKSLRIYARNKYGNRSIEYPIFPDEPYKSYKRLILRNSGNDYGFTMLRDATAQMVVRHFNFDTQAYQPAALYINGEYWGIHNIRERYDRHYLERVYGIDPNNIDYLTNRWSVVEGNNLDYSSLIAYILSNDISSNHHYNYITTKIDIDNFIDYYVAQIYFANIDWPQNNIDFWRLRRSFNPDAEKGHDGRWRWLLYDVDYSLGFTDPIIGFISNESFDMINWVLSERNLLNDQQWPGQIFRSLIENDQFKNQFINQIADHLNASFEERRVKPIIDYNMNLIKDEIPNHSNRWNNPSSLDQWESNVEVMFRFVENRPHYLREHVMKHFGIDSLDELIIEEYDQTKGDLYLNSLLINGDTPGIDQEPFPWSGTYFSGVPVTITAVPKQEYTFSHWEIDDQLFTEPTLTLLPDTTDTIRVFFEEVTALEPEHFSLAEEDYLFDYFSAETPRGEYPEGMRFVYMSDIEPGLESEIEGSVTGSYNLFSRTRINGLGEAGFSFINTSNLDGNPGFPGRKLGGAVLYLNTEERSRVKVEWNAGTMEPNSRIYNIQLQYRVGSDGLFKNVLDESGAPVEYKRNEERGHEEAMSPVILPSEVENQSHVEILWRYYSTGERVDEESGQRAQLHVSEISVTSKPLGYIENPDPDPEPLVPNSFKLYQNFPNPFHPSSTIQYDLPKDQHVKLEIYSISGQYIKTAINQQVPAGRHTVVIDASTFASGVYLYRIITNEFTETLRMSVIK